MATTTELRKSICGICEITQCGLDVHVENEIIVKVEGSKENPFNKGVLCSKGAATCEYVYHPDRIQTPLQRVGTRGSGEFVPISWEEAYRLIAERLNTIKQHDGPEAVAFFSGYAKHFRPYLKRLVHAFGSPNYLATTSNCFEATNMAQKLVFGQPTVPDIKNARCLLIWSRNPFHSNIHLARNILQAKENGLKIITVDPRITPTVERSDLHLRLRPGTDGALALAMAHTIISEKLYDEEFVAQYTHGFAEFCQYVQEFTPERGEEISGVAADKIREAARLYAGSRPASILPSACSVTHHTNGIQNQRAIFALAGLTGNFDVVGGNIANPPGFIGVFGGFATRSGEYSQPRRWEEMAPRIGEERFPVWSQLVDEGQAMHLPAQLRSGKPYPIKALVGFGLNNRMWPDSDNLLHSIDDLDFFVNVDIFMTDSCRHADIVLPACTSLERSELRCYSQRFVILTQPAIQPLYQSRSDANIIFALAAHLGIDDPLLAAGYEASMDWILAPSGMTVAELKQHPAGMAVSNPILYVPRKYQHKGFNTPSGKLEFASLVLESTGKKRGWEALPVYQPPSDSAQTTTALIKEYPFVLNTGARLPMFIHTRTFRLPSMTKFRPHPAADLNPKDAAALGVQQGDEIKISTPGGAIAVRANLTDMVLSGVVHMYHGYPQANVNQLVDRDYLDPISGFPGCKALLCRVEKITEKKDGIEGGRL